MVVVETSEPVPVLGDVDEEEPEMEASSSKSSTLPGGLEGSSSEWSRSYRLQNGLVPKHHN